MVADPIPAIYRLAGTQIVSHWYRPHIATDYAFLHIYGSTPRHPFLTPAPKVHTAARKLLPEHTGVRPCISTYFTDFEYFF